MRSPEPEVKINIQTPKINGQNGLKEERKTSLSPSQEKRRVSRAAWSSARGGRGEHLLEAHSNQTRLKSRSYFALGNNAFLNS